MLLQRMVKMHYSWKYEFLRPTQKEVTHCYLEKWPGSCKLDVSLLRSAEPMFDSKCCTVAPFCLPIATVTTELARATMFTELASTLM